MKYSPVIASLFFAAFIFTAPTSLLAHEGAHDAGEQGKEHGKYEEGSGSSVIEDPHGDNHEYGKEQHEEEEGSFSRHYKKYRNKRKEGSSGVGRPEETHPPKTTNEDSGAH